MTSPWASPQCHWGPFWLLAWLVRGQALAGRVGGLCPLGSVSAVLVSTQQVETLGSAAKLRDVSCVDCEGSSWQAGPVPSWGCVGVGLAGRREPLGSVGCKCCQALKEPARLPKCLPGILVCRPPSGCVIKAGNKIGGNPFFLASSWRGAYCAHTDEQIHTHGRYCTSTRGTVCSGDNWVVGEGMSGDGGG